MKKYGYWVALLALIVFNLYVFYPTSPETVVERNIRWAEGNGKQLEQVLEHYRSTGEEQKERCARYLIAHMDRRATFTYEGAAQQNEVITPDLLAIRADFLIENIDLAFEVWKRYPWCSHLTEQEFCRLILPYRIKNEPLEDWRKFYYNKYKEVADSLAAAGATMQEAVFFFNCRYGKRYTHDAEKYRGDLSKQILVQENDYVRAGTPLSDGAITPADILAIKGPTAVQEYIVNEVQDVYRLQGVKINDKHFEIIVRQMMRKVEIVEPGDTRFLEQQVVDKQEFMEENDRIWGKKVVVDAGDSQNLQPGQIVTARKLRDENSMLKRRDLKPVEVRDAIPATSTQILQGITRAALGTSSFMSAASFQETTKVLNEAAINGKVDRLEGMKENVICGHLIPAGTGQREFDKIVVGSKEEHDRIMANRKNVLDYSEVE